VLLSKLNLHLLLGVFEKINYSKKLYIHTYVPIFKRQNYFFNLIFLF
jgi:hypothetical protein